MERLLYCKITFDEVSTAQCSCLCVPIFNIRLTLSAVFSERWNGFSSARGSRVTGKKLTLKQAINQVPSYLL